MAKDEEVPSGRELFWLRITAAAIDVLAGLAVASLAAVALYAVSDGRLRSSTPLKVARCEALRALPASLLEGVAAPVGSRPVAAELCTVSMAGLETGRYATVALRAQEGEVVRSLAFSRPVDRQGEPISPFVLDWIWPLAFILAMAAGEGLAGGTLGKRLVGLKAVAADGTRLGIGRALLRNLVIYGGAALVLIAPLVAAVAHVRLSPLAYYVAVGVFGLLVLAPFAMLAEASARPLYDRWAGADVVRS